MCILSMLGFGFPNGPLIKIGLDERRLEEVILGLLACSILCGG